MFHHIAGAQMRVRAGHAFELIPWAWGLLRESRQRARAGVSRTLFQDSEPTCEVLSWAACCKHHEARNL